jgi:hypothetical protein
MTVIRAVEADDRAILRCGSANVLKEIPQLVAHQVKIHSLFGGVLVGIAQDHREIALVCHILDGAAHQHEEGKGILSV